MIRGFFITVLMVFSVVLSGQEATISADQSSAERLLQSGSKLTIGGYAQIDYNQPFGSGTKNLGELDVHRLVMLFGYKFSDRASFVTEIEFEHVKEVFVEQAFLQYKINNQVNFRGGLILVPMGIINELHEPPTFNGVERPMVDKYISPTTWREVGLGLAGNLTAPSVKYQVYLMNGFNGYDGDPHLDGKNGLRKGRQKGAESFMSSPNITFRGEYYGIRGLSLGLSGYFGNSQSSLADGLSKSDNAAIARYDSSKVGISMLGIDAKYSRSGIQLKGQVYYTTLSNTTQYNTFTADGTTLNDLGSKMVGYYLELGYNIFAKAEAFDTELIPFARYEMYNTHYEVSESIVANDSYLNKIITAGLTWKLSPGAVLKLDTQFMKSGTSGSILKVFNAGVGVMF